MADAAERTLIGGGTNSSNEEPFQEDRLLALEIRPRKFGFVVFEGPTRLLDWGVRSYPSRGAQRRATLEKRICVLLDLYVPSVVVMRWRDSSSRKARRAILSAVQAIRTEARSRSIKLQSLNTREIRCFFAEHGCATKHQIASLLAKWFEELSWKLPPERKAWQGEAYIMLIFDAAATGIAFLDQRRRLAEKTVRR